jgi:metallo-beta-lactamase class B
MKLKVHFLILVILEAFLIKGFAQSDNNHALRIEHLADNFYVYESWSEYKPGTYYSSNAMYLVTNEGIVLFDTPWDKKDFQPLLDSIEQKHHKKVILCIATHSHADRTAGLEYYRSRGIKTYTTQLTDSISALTGEKRAEFLFENDTVFKIAEYTFETFYPGPGHAPDNIVIWFPHQKVLYGACFIKSTETDNLGNLSDANPVEWEKNMRKLIARYPDPFYVITGHQDWHNLDSEKYTLQLLTKFNKTK